MNQIDHLRYIEYCLLILHCNIAGIIKEAKKVRKSNRGHNCELRKFLDSICDREPKSLELLKEISKQYNNFQLKKISELEEENRRLKIKD
jgi:hypothetical protein